MSVAAAKGSIGAVSGAEYQSSEDQGPSTSEVTTAFVWDAMSIKVHHGDGTVVLMFTFM